MNFYTLSVEKTQEHISHIKADSATSGNVIRGAPKKSLFKRFIMQFSDFMIIILLAAAGISFFISYLNGDRDVAEPVIILAIVVLNAILGVVEEKRADNALEALKKMSSPSAVIRRGGKQISVPASDIRVGDILILSSGNCVCADARLLCSAELETDESALTGEAMPVSKRSDCILPDKTPLAEQCNMVFSATNVVHGRGEAIVTAIGMDTEMGKIAGLISCEDDEPTPLQKKLAQTGKHLGIGALCVCGAIFIMGLFKQMPLFTMFLTSVSLAVAAIPEGLPAIVTIVLAMGVQRMAKKRSIVKHLSAVEALGGATVICADKTGTLTQNKMTVVSVSSADADFLFKMSVLCCDNSENPTENAIISEANRLGIEKKAFDARIARISEIPFDSKRKLMSVMVSCSSDYIKSISIENGKKHTIFGKVDTNNIASGAEWSSGRASNRGSGAEWSSGRASNRGSSVEWTNDRVSSRISNEMSSQAGGEMIGERTIYSGGNHCIITKGASEYILQKCSHYIENGEIKLLSSSKKRLITQEAQKMGKNALRVIGAAYKDTSEKTIRESNMVFMGLIGIMDPPRPEAKQAVRECLRAGIRPIMITGDNKITAEAVAKQVGIIGKATGGDEISHMSDDKLTEYSIFSRVTPSDKMRIVNALKKCGNIVAMTGDGVNDAPALKAADIGCSMGLRGTDVAKEASDIILVDDNFATIVAAVHEGRGIFENIRKSIKFLLSSNIGEIITIFFGILFGWEPPLLAIQLLWVNLVTDSLPALSLGLDPIDNNIMLQKPKNPQKGFFYGGLWTSIIVEGGMIGGLALLAFSIGKNIFDTSTVPIIGRTMAFCVLSISQLFHAFNMRSERSVIGIEFFKNPYLIFSLLTGIVMQIAVVTISPLAGLFKVCNLNPNQWLIVSILSILPIFIVELQKKISQGILP